MPLRDALASAAPWPSPNAVASLRHIGSDEAPHPGHGARAIRLACLSGSVHAPPALVRVPTVLREVCVCVCVCVRARRERERERERGVCACTLAKYVHLLSNTRTHT